MNKTQIEWVINPDGSHGYTWNPVTGCLNGCSYCYAAKMAKRFKQSFEPTFHEERLREPFKLKKPSTIFVGGWIK
jgi:Bacteriophage protein gp37